MLVVLMVVVGASEMEVVHVNKLVVVDVSEVVVVDVCVNELVVGVIYVEVFDAGELVADVIEMMMIYVGGVVVVSELVDASEVVVVDMSEMVLDED